MFQETHNKKVIRVSRR